MVNEPTRKDAGIVTAYGAAVRGGYTGTYEEFCRQQANYAEYAQAVEEAKEAAQEAAGTAQTAAGTATAGAESAGASADDAIDAAAVAVDAAASARQDKEAAAGSATAAAGSATAAGQAKTAAEGAATAAGEAQTAAEGAATAAGQAKTAAESAATAAGQSKTAAESAAGRAEAAMESYAEMTAEAETLAPGAPATAEIDRTGDHPVLKLGTPTGTQGPKGEAGTSPSVTVTDITGGHRVTITDDDGDHTFDVMNGIDGTGAVDSVNGKAGAVVLDGRDINVNNSVQNPETVADALGDLKSALHDLGDGYIALNVTEFIIDKTLSSDGKSETANNSRRLSDFIPVTPGSTLYFYITANTERCAFYTSANYADVTGWTFNVSAGNPTTKVVPANAAYIKIGWHKNNGIPKVITIAPFVDDTAGNGTLNKVWSANKLTNEISALASANTAEETNITAIINKSQFETTSATINSFYYKNDGTTGTAGSWTSAVTSVTPGEILKVSGYVYTGTSFSLIVYFDENDNFLSKAYQNDNASSKEYTDLIVTVPQGAAKIGVNCMHNNSKSPIIKRMAIYASSAQITETNNFIAKEDAKVDNISKYVNFENESGTFANGFYNASGGGWQANNSYGTITFPASYGDLFLVTGETLAAAGFALALVFNANNEIIERVYDGRNISAKTSVTDMPLCISNPNAAWVALLGGYYEAYPYYPRAKRAITKYAHVRKTAVCFGDSTFGNASPTVDIPSKLTVRTGNTVLNGAFGGCRMSYHNSNYGAFSMYKLADAICTGVWTDQDAAMADPTFEPPAYAAQHLANLKSTDFDKVGFITIAYGTNDWRAGNALDDENNPKNTYTIAGALRYSLEKIMTTYPQIDIYVLSPLWRVVKLDGETDENPTGYCDTTPNGLPEADQYYLMDVCDTLKKVADEYHATFINDFDLGINRYNWKNWLVDGTHPNQNCQDLMIGNMIKSIKNILV